MSNDLQVDVLALREEVKTKYHAVATTSRCAVDTFGGAGGESKARLFEVYGYAFLARKRK